MYIWLVIERAGICFWDLYEKIIHSRSFRPAWEPSCGVEFSVLKVLGALAFSTREEQDTQVQTSQASETMEVY